jgi:hypothetical protein
MLAVFAGRFLSFRPKGEIFLLYGKSISLRQRQIDSSRSFGMTEQDRH